MAQHKIAFLARAQPDTKLVEEQLKGLDYELVEEQLKGLDYELDVHVCSSEGETIEAMRGADIIINRGVPMPREVIREIDTARAIVSFGHGFDRIDYNAATDQSVMVVNAAGFCSEEVSNHAIMLLLACAKNLTILNDLVKQGRWEARSRLLPMGEIDGQTVGLVGFGNIARPTARKAKVFGLEVIAYDPYAQPWIAKEYAVELVGSLEQLAGRSDYVSVHVPLNDETHKLIGQSFFRAMKPTAFIINTCRGPTIDEQALIKALQDGEIAGAGLDVLEQEPPPPDNPLLKMDNVIVTPHSAGASGHARVAAPTQIGQEAARILKGMWPMSLVNPEVRNKIEARKLAANV